MPEIFTAKPLTVKEVRESLARFEDWETVQFLTCNALLSNVYRVQIAVFACGPMLEPRMYENPNIWGYNESIDKYDGEK